MQIRLQIRQFNDTMNSELGFDGKPLSVDIHVGESEFENKDKILKNISRADPEVWEGDRLRLKGHIRPFLKWAGGKRGLLDVILPMIPKGIFSYCEPFIGGGSVLFALRPSTAVVNDLNSDLITTYRVIRDNVEALIESLKKHEKTRDYFYRIRNLDRDKGAYRVLSDVEKSSRLIYLNKTCFNGLFRVNSSGEFNTPFGKYVSPNIVNETVLRTVSDYLRSNDIRFYSEDFAETLKRVNEGFVYLDPPYDPISVSSSFVAYNKGGFDKSEQIRLKKCCDDLTQRGIKFLLSNSETEFIRDLYRDYDIRTVSAKRVINSDGTKRGFVKEVLIKNY